jgi:DNA-binding NarL/FixJ family response regulator
MALTEQSRAILSAIAKGHTYEQILVQDLAWTYHDIFRAAAEALQLANAPVTDKSSDPAKTYDVAQIRQVHTNAYEKWSPEEDERLRQLNHSGSTITEIANALHRQPSAIRSRLTKLNLPVPGTPGSGPL